MLVDKLSNLEQLYNLTMSVHQKYKTDAFQEVTPIFNERMFLSLSQSSNVLFMDDELNLLPVSYKQKHLEIDSDSQLHKNVEI